MRAREAGVVAVFRQDQVQFPLGQPLPADLIRRIVEFRVGESARRANERAAARAARAAARAKAKKASQ